MSQRHPGRRHACITPADPDRFGHLEIAVELEQLDLRVQVGGWDHVREINRHPNIACSV
jgi:hypothetical protein